MKDTEIMLLCEELNFIDAELFKNHPVSPPEMAQVKRITEAYLSLIFPTVCLSGKRLGVEKKAKRLYRLLLSTLSAVTDKKRAERLSERLMHKLPSIKAMLAEDALAIFEGDPAATSPLEVIICYPGFFAIAIQRFANAIYLLGIPYLSRMMTEYAHGRTGIDIHPGARIGRSFCIDHGTGVVIGETAKIGDRVKIYQGVTVGAKSFERDSDGKLIKGKKRHPTIGSDCVIYAGATILGGDTVIGNGCVIGGNVWLTHSLSDGERVYFENKN